MIDPFEFVHKLEDYIYDGDTRSYMYIASTPDQKLKTIGKFTEEFLDRDYQVLTSNTKMLEVEHHFSSGKVIMYFTHISEFEGISPDIVTIDDVIVDVHTDQMDKLMKKFWTTSQVNTIIPQQGDVMIDCVHTNEERIAKVRSVFEAITHMAENYPNESAVMDGLIEAAKEAEGSLQAIEKTLTGKTTE